MNLHEECLLKYLLNTSELSVETDLLRQYNEMILKGIVDISVIANTPKLSYITNRS